MWVKVLDKQLFANLKLETLWIDSLIYSYVAGLKVGQMTQTIRVTWVTFLVGQVGIIRKIIYLDVTRIFNRSHVL